MSASLRALGADHAELLGRLLDEALDVRPERRAAWLNELSLPEPTLRELLAALVSQLPDASTPYTSTDSSAVQVAAQIARVLATPPASAGQTYGPYRTLALLGEGGMGEVWLAERSDGLFQRRVALKLPRADRIAGALLKRFARERNILAGLTHPYIARLLDAGVTHTGQPYLALEYVEGTTLFEHCDQRKAPLSERIGLLMQIIAAVQHAHQSLVVHLDLKPSNILVTRDGTVRLLDFGIAKLLSDQPADSLELTRRGDRALTPAYASPEQIAGMPVGIASDVYSLGVVMYMLLCGQRPYRLTHESRPALEQAVIEQTPTRPSQQSASAALAAVRGTTPGKLARALTGDLDTIVLHALKKNPGERYPTADALLQDLRRHLARQPVQARPDSLAYRTRKFVSRNRRALSAATLGLALLAGGVRAIAVEARRATHAAEIAERERERADREARDAHAERDYARKQLSRAEAINDLNAYLLSEAAPAGQPFTVGVLLEKAEQLVDRESSEDDENHVAMLTEIGSQYTNQEDYKRARPVLERAFELATRLNVVELRATSACALARAVLYDGEYARAETLVSEAERSLPDDARYLPQRIFCLIRATQVARKAGALQLSLERALAAERLMAATPTASGLLRQRAALNLALSYRTLGRSREALAYFARAWIGLNELGRAETETASILLCGWAWAYRDLGALDEAERLYRRALAIETSGADDTGVSPQLLVRLAGTVAESGRLTDALTLLERATVQATRYHNVMAINDAWVLLTEIHAQRGDVRRAAKAYAEAESRLQAKDTPGLDRAALLHARARLHEAQNEYAAASEAADAAVNIATAVAPESALLSTYLMRRANARLLQGQARQAEHDARRVLQLEAARALPERASSRLGRAHRLLGLALHAQGEVSAAQAECTLAYAHLSATLAGEASTGTSCSTPALGSISSTPPPRAAPKRPANPKTLGAEPTETRE